ncbi:MAG: HPr kinase/phosphorylase [candidate division Zixibacteria bacterium]|nr:HPr kinase/phosphorylase [Candidatus Tariuqbacter arcticus]
MQNKTESTLSVKQFFEDNQDRLNLHLDIGASGLKRKITEKDIHRPGLALAGFVELFAFHRVQVLGNTEILFLNKLNDADRIEALKRIFQFQIPCIIITYNNPVPQEIVKLADANEVPVFRTPLSTSDLTHLLIDYLDDQFAPLTIIHGSLVDVYGTGMLFTGRSGIGKSEIALDLVERGHRLVSDDVVQITRKAEGVLIGSGTEMLKHFMEIRGVGIIDIRRMFGIRAIRLQKRIEMEIELAEWDGNEDYERLGLEEQKKKILGVSIQYVRLPIFPGRNIAVIAESLALNLHLKVYGFHPAREFNDLLARSIQDRRRVRQYLERDTE